MPHFPQTARFPRNFALGSVPGSLSFPHPHRSALAFRRGWSASSVAAARPGTVRGGAWSGARSAAGVMLFKLEAPESHIPGMPGADPAGQENFFKNVLENRRGLRTLHTDGVLL